MIPRTSMSLSLQRTLSLKLTVCFFSILPAECLQLQNPFVQEVTQWLDNKHIPFQTMDWQGLGMVIPNHSQMLTIVPEEHDRGFILHVLPTPSSADQVAAPTLTKQLTEQMQDIAIIHLHQDVWQNKGDIVRSRILVRCGRGQRIFARKTRVRRIRSNQAVPFLHANHLWSATKAKYYYGLFVNSEEKDDEELLVAVASISARRKVVRDGISHRSHELLRFCSLRDATVVGGISKLLKAFISDHQPDDIVTVVDRDWGSGDGWHTLGFTTVHVMPPLTMMVDQTGVRRHLVGVGIHHDEDAANHDRLGLPRHVLEQLARISESEPAYECLLQHGFFPVHDAGVERLFMTIDDSAAARQRAERDNSQYTMMALWAKSVPSYTTSYYSPNSGIVALLKHVENMDCPVKDSVEEHASLESWRSTSAASARLILGTPSMLDTTATLEIRERQDGWHTVGIVGGMTKSIYHGVYQVRRDGRIDPEALGPSEYIRTMASLVVSATVGHEDNHALRFLHFGFGAGSLVRLLAHVIPDSQHVAIELDTAVVTIANDLGLVQPPNQRLVPGDALAYRRLDSEEPFDCICIDVFDGNNLLPPDFYSISFLESLRDNLLRQDGCVVQNFHAGNDKVHRQLEDATTAYRSVFPTCYLVSSLDSKPNGGNNLILASLKEGECSMLETSALRAQERCNLRFDVASRVRGARRCQGA